MEKDNTQVYDDNKETLYRLVAFIAGCLFIILIALFVTNLGMQKNIDARLPLRNFQQLSQLTEEDERGGFLTLDSNLVQEHQLTDVFLIEKGIDTIVPIAKDAQCLDIETQPGSMAFSGINAFEVPLPLCITPEVLATWTATVTVRGGYQPYELHTCCKDYFSNVTVYQKGEKLGVIKITWTPDPVEYVYDVDGVIVCYEQTFHASFAVVSDTDAIPGDFIIQLESSKYPTVTVDPTNVPATCTPVTPTWDSSMDIVGKGVDFYVRTWWSGCKLSEQAFALILVRDSYQFPNK